MSNAEKDEREFKNEQRNRDILTERTGDKDLRERCSIFLDSEAWVTADHWPEELDALTNFVERELAELRQQHAPDSHMDEYIIPAFTQMLRFVRLALAGEKTLYSQARFMAEKLLEYGFPKQSGYLMDVVEGKGEIIHAKETELSTAEPTNWMGPRMEVKPEPKV